MKLVPYEMDNLRNPHIGDPQRICRQWAEMCGSNRLSAKER